MIRFGGKVVRTSRESQRTSRTGFGEASDTGPSRTDR